MQLIKVSLVMLCCVLMTACSITKVKKDPEQLAGTLLIFDVTNNGTQMQKLYFVHTDYIRVDQGDKTNYWLFDRQKKTLYKIDEETKTVREITAAATTADTAGYDLDVESSASGLMVEGATKHHKIYLNGKLCANEVTVDEMLPSELQALRELSQVASLDKQVIEGLEEGGCEYALNVAHPDKIFEFGFPVRYWDTFGGKRFLKEYRLRVLPREDDFSELPDWY